jgi:hypothetical protein
MAIATSITAGIIAAGATTAGNIYAANKQSSASKRAGEQQSAANRDALEFEREQDRLDREQFEKTEAENQRRWEDTQREEQRRYEIEQQLGSQRYGDSLRRAEMADAFEKEKYATRRGDMAPYRASGVQALQRLGQVANLTIRPTTPPGQPAPPMADLARGA